MNNKQHNTLNDMLNFWTIIQFLILFPIVIIIPFFASLLTFSFIGETIQVFVISLVITGCFIIVFIFRNRIIQKMFNTWSKLTFYNFINIIDEIYNIVIIPSVIMITFFFYNLYIFQDGLIHLLGIFFYLIIINTIFTGALTNFGKTKIEVNQFFINISDLLERQQWLEKITKKLEKTLKKGNYQVPSDVITYNINNKLRSSDNIKEDLKKISNWMLSEKKDDSVIDSLTKIVPEDEIRPLKKLTIKDRIINISPEIYKYVFYIILIIIILTNQPELFEKILDWILK